MKAAGIYQWIKNGEVKRRRATLESTGVKNEDGKVYWRLLKKDGSPSNIFAEQFILDVPWAQGKWFVKLDASVILSKYPQLKVETERSKEMTDKEYLDFLHNTFEQM